MKKIVRLPIALLPNKKKCCCTPETCTCAPKVKANKEKKK